MSYSVYFKYGNTKYRLPVNPEEIKLSRELSVDTYQVLGTGQVSVPSYHNLEQISFEAEFPSKRYHYVKTGGQFHDADYYEKMFKKAQKNKKPIRFIASNGITDDISVMVLVKNVESVEKAGEEGDKYLTLTLLEHKAPGKKYVAVPTSTSLMKEEEQQSAGQENPAVSENKTHTVRENDTLWSIAKQYYGDGGRYTKLVSANPEIRNPNLIHAGQILNIPV